MEWMIAVKAFPYVLSGVELLKGMFTDKQRKYANPAMAVIGGVVMAYQMGGNHEVWALLGEGLMAAVLAVGGYKGTKMLRRE